MIFNIILTILFSPDVLFPLPAAAMRGFPAIQNEVYVKGMFILTIISGMLMFTSINDCCYVRAMTIFNKQNAVAYFYSYKGIFLSVLRNVVFTLLILPPMLYGPISTKEFLRRTRENGEMRYLGSYAKDPNMVYLAFDLDNWIVYFLILELLGGLGLIHFGNLAASYLMLRKINATREYMSERTFKQQKQLTWMLIFQSVPFLGQYIEEKTVFVDIRTVSVVHPSVRRPK
ncbi:unnamed protein product [Caenorhabditis auriculariae]|uniref:Uncharacterized protein n=1 Tax=Caenorhabditis auriculariae TaxID=2777116 RepID=A0A8S1HWK5_9PELO|nr:unnamed protein product [Caenorhabditis auriculariae]